MKKITFPALYLLASIGTFGQQPLSAQAIGLPVTHEKIASRNGGFYVVDSLYCYSFDPATQTQTPTERQYNLDFTQEGGVLQSRKEQYLPWLDQWRFQNLLSYTYDAQHNLVEQTTRQWDTLAQNWVNSLRTLNTPNQNGDFTEVLNQEWRNNTWRNVDKVSFAYDQLGHLSTLEQQLWDTLANAWKKNLRIIYAVNTGGHIASTLFQLWDSAANVYKSLSRSFHSFDQQNPNLETEVLTEIWDTAGQTWVKSSRTTKEYDPNSNLTEELFQLWDAPLSTWLNVRRTLQNFNADNQPTLRTELNWNGSLWVNSFQTVNFYDPNGNLLRFAVAQWQGNAWTQLSSCDFYWRLHHQTATREAKQDTPCTVPNPYHPGDPITCPDLPSSSALTIALFDLSGKLVLRESTEHQNFFKLAPLLPPGLYILAILEKNRVVHRQKLVIH